MIANGVEARMAAGEELGGVNTGANAVSLGEDVERAGLGGNQRNQVLRAWSATYVGGAVSDA